MAIPVGHLRDDDAVISSINTTPLVDVMLVLLIIFLIAIPAAMSSVPIALPRERVEARESRPGTIVISVDRAGDIFWFDARLSGADALLTRLQAVSRMNPQPEVQIRGDRTARYAGVGRILHACQRSGIARVAFITEPPPLGG